MAKLSKSQIVAALADSTKLSKKDVTSVLDQLTELAYTEVKKSGEFAIAGLGKFVKKLRKARMGINPKTMEKIKIPAKTVVKFRLAKAAKEAVL